MGYMGKPGAPEVQAVVTDVLARINAAGKASGILSSDPKLLQVYRDMGINFLAVGSDVGLLGGSMRALRNKFL
jgi:4-hydroxy-2-oxoheptanedioate aldolase